MRLQLRRTCKPLVYSLQNGTFDSRKFMFDVDSCTSNTRGIVVSILNGNLTKNLPKQKRHTRENSFCSYVFAATSIYTGLLPDTGIPPEAFVIDIVCQWIGLQTSLWIQNSATTEVEFWNGSPQTLMVDTTISLFRVFFL